MAWVIERPTVADADEIGRVHVEVWRQAYDGLMPEAYLASRDPVAFADFWRDRLAAADRGTAWVARDDAGIVGFASTGPGRDADRPVDLELIAINVLARAHGTGLADDLLAAAVGDRAAYLWVVDGNERAMAFYRRHGFADDGTRKPEPDTGVTEVRMVRRQPPAN